MQTKPPDPNTFMDKLRIKALNCQGLKNKCENPDLLNKITSSEIFGVSETWMSDSDAKIQIPGYNFYPFCRKKEKGSTRGGIGLFIKTEFKKGIKILYNISNEICIWCKLDKNFFRYDNDVYIGNVYIPPEGSSREKRLKEDHFKSLTETFMKIKSENVILIGDFNARTRDDEDTVMEEKTHQLETIPSSINSSKINTRRCNQDEKTNKYGKKLVEMCLATNSYIANGRTLGDCLVDLVNQLLQFIKSVKY